jgi:hypothetical protein
MVQRDNSRHFVTDSLQLLQNGYKEKCTETAAGFLKREAAHNVSRSTRARGA